MKFATARDLKNQTSRLLHSHQEVVITLHGAPCALLVPLNEEDLEDFILAKYYDLEHDSQKIKKSHSKKKLTSLDQKLASLKSHD